MSYTGPGLGQYSAGNGPLVTMEPGDELPTVHLGLTYTGDELEQGPQVHTAGIPLWVVLVAGVYWLANRVGSRI